VRLYDHLFKSPDPEDVPDGHDWRVNLNPNSLEVLANAQIEPSVKDARPGDRFQFERIGYFTVDKDSTPEKLVFNRSVTLKDAWAKEVKKGAAPAKK
jgi:glutaminyl-tRNA synthetase